MRRAQDTRRVPFGECLSRDGEGLGGEACRRRPDPPRLQARDDQGFSDSLPRINSIMEASSMREIAKLFFPASLSDAPTR